MDVITTNSLVIGVFFTFLLGVLLYLKKTDPMVGCEKWRLKGCIHISGGECKFPVCARLNKFRSLGGDLEK
jgi:hypothetical protein